MRRTSSRQRGTALILVTVTLLVATVFAALLITVPRAGFDSAIIVEAKEKALLTADAGLRDAYVQLCGGAITPGTTPVSKGSSASPLRFGANAEDGYWFTVSQLVSGDSSNLVIDSWGKSKSTAGGSATTVQCQMQAILKKPSIPFTGDLPGTITALRGTPASGQSEQTFKVDGVGSASITGMDKDLAYNTFGIGFVGYGNQTLSIDKTKNWNNWDSGNGVTGLSGGNNATSGNSINHGSNSGDLTAFMAAAFASPSPSSPVSTTQTSFTYSGQFTSSSTDPKFVMVKPTGANVGASPVVTISADFYGVLAIDLSGMTGAFGNPNGQSGGLIEFSANSKIKGLVLIKGPTTGSVHQWSEKLKIMRNNGQSGGLEGALAFEMNRIGNADVNLADLNGNTPVGMSSVAIANAIKALGGSDSYSIVVTRVVK